MNTCTTPARLNLTEAIRTVLFSSYKTHVLHYGQLPIRTAINDEQKIWFNAEDVCEALGRGKVREALTNHVHADDWAIRFEGTDNTKTDYINAGGLLSLAHASAKKHAKPFFEWFLQNVSVPSDLKSEQVEPKRKPERFTAEQGNNAYHIHQAFAAVTDLLSPVAPTAPYRPYLDHVGHSEFYSLMLVLSDRLKEVFEDLDLEM
ncbi:MAG: Bro-N domain-containing protein [Magnetococcus sp. YQC-9]